MKKYFKITMSILMSAILVISLASCNSSEKDTDAKIKNTVDAYYENMKNSIDEGDSYSDIASRIKKYLDREGFKTIFHFQRRRQKEAVRLLQQYLES